MIFLGKIFLCEYDGNYKIPSYSVVILKMQMEIKEIKCYDFFCGITVNSDGKQNWSIGRKGEIKKKKAIICNLFFSDKKQSTDELLSKILQKMMKVAI